MSNEKLINVMRNFDEEYLFALLGDLKDALIEWKDSKNILTKEKIIDIILAVYGLSLFKQEEFRYKFFLSTEDKLFLKHVAQLYNYSFNGSSNEQILLAKKLSKVSFDDNPLFEYIIKGYFGDTEFEFHKNEKELPVESVERLGYKFYELYDYQYMIKQQAINDLSNKDKDLYKILIHMPTGTGKTKTTMHIISHYLNFITKGQGIVVWIAHSDELLMQAYETFKNVWSHLSLFDINVYKGWVEFPNTLEDGILFTSIQALQKKYGKHVFEEISNKASLIVFDEVHKSGAEITKKCVDSLMKKNNEYGKKFIGLTATPGRTTEVSKANALFSEDFDHIIGIDVDKINAISLSANEARNYRGSKDPIRYFQEQGYLSNIEKQMLEFEIDPKVLIQLKKELQNDNENYSDNLVKKISLSKARNDKIIEELVKLNKEQIPTIVFACSLQHAKLLSAFLKMLNIENSLVYGDMASTDRKRAIDDFKKGKVNIIINFEILTTGFDSTNIKCVFITRPTKSVILYSQMIGRGLRGPKMGGNENCLLIDVQENLYSYNENAAFKHFNSYWERG